MDEEINIAHAPNGSVDPIVDTIERIHLVRLDSQVEQAGNTNNGQKPKEHAAHEKGSGDDQGIAKKRPLQKLWVMPAPTVRPTLTMLKTDPISGART